MGEINYSIYFTSKRRTHFLTSIKVMVVASLVFSWVASLQGLLQYRKAFRFNPLGKANNSIV